MSRIVRVELGERSYEIRIGAGRSFERIFPENGCRVLLVADSNVDPLHGERCCEELEACGVSVERVVVPAGEPSKSLDQVAVLYDAAANARLDRGSFIVALGGGMVGDLAGYAAATYMRGIRFVQVPTTLLAMVDSSVGGKTGINRPQGKNLVGAFYQPAAVVADLDSLLTLEQREYVSGLAEVVKYGVIWDASFFAHIESQAAALLGREPAVLEAVVARCCEIKAEVVAMDERESGVRAILNFGHTFGHALENTAGYGRFLHGEAVAAGMAFAAKLSVRAKGFPEEQLRRVVELLRRFGLPTGAADAEDWPAIRQAMASDKKVRDGTLRFVLAQGLGSVVFGCPVEEGSLEATFRAQ